MKKILWEGFMWLNMKDGTDRFERFGTKPELWTSKADAMDFFSSNYGYRARKVKVVVYAPEE